MHQAYFSAILRTILDVGAPGLEIFDVRNRRNFQPLLTTRRPDFDIIRDARVEPQVASTQQHGAVSQPKINTHLAGIFHHSGQLGFRILWLGKGVHFHFIELVAALDAADIPTSAHLFTSEAGFISRVAERQLRLIQDLVHV